MLHDVSTLYFETDAGDGLREPGFSKERRLDPQITIGLLTAAASGFPLAVEAFEGNKAETATMLPVIHAFKTTHNLTDVTVVADAGMISEANQIARQACGLSFILGTKIPFVPDVVARWRTNTLVRRFPTGMSSHDLSRAAVAISSGSNANSITNREPSSTTAAHRNLHPVANLHNGPNVAMTAGNHPVEKCAGVFTGLSLPGGRLRRRTGTRLRCV